jgi:hypothetical protein
VNGFEFMAAHPVLTVILAVIALIGVDQVVGSIAGIWRE